MRAACFAKLRTPSRVHCETGGSRFRGAEVAVLSSAHSVARWVLCDRDADSVRIQGADAAREGEADEGKPIAGSGWPGAGHRVPGTGYRAPGGRDAGGRDADSRDAGGRVAHPEQSAASRAPLSPPSCPSRLVTGGANCAQRATRRREASGTVRNGQLGAERRQLPQQRGSLSRDLEFFVGWDHEHIDGSAVR
jgi:hypothetical protein